MVAVDYSFLLSYCIILFENSGRIDLERSHFLGTCVRHYRDSPHLADGTWPSLDEFTYETPEGLLGTIPQDSTTPDPFLEIERLLALSDDSFPDPLVLASSEPDRYQSEAPFDPFKDFKPENFNDQEPSAFVNIAIVVAIVIGVLVLVCCACVLVCYCCVKCRRRGATLGNVE